MVLSLGSLHAEYQMPPTHRSRVGGSNLNDEEMKQCVILYNNIIKLEQNLNKQQSIVIRNNR